MSLAAPTNRFRLSCSNLTASFVGVSEEGWTWINMESSTNKYSTSLKLSFEMHHLSAVPNPSFLRLFNRGVLTIAHIDGDDQFFLADSLSWWFPW